MRFVSEMKISCPSKLWQLGNPIKVAMSVATSSNGPMTSTFLLKNTKKTLTPSTKRTHLLNKVCLVINLEGFYTGHQYLPQELGGCDWPRKQKGLIHYKPSVPWPNPSPTDRQTAYYGTTHVHRLHTTQTCLYHVASELKTDAQHLFEQQKTPKRPLVAYKGGIIK